MHFRTCSSLKGEETARSTLKIKFSTQSDLTQTAVERWHSRHHIKYSDLEEITFV